MKKLSSVLLVICILATATLGIFSASAADPAPKTYEGWIESAGTPIFSNFEGVNTGDPIDYVLQGNKGISNSGGSQDYWVINDGYAPDNASAVNGRLSFDSYHQSFRNVARTEWIGYNFAKTYTVTELMYQLGNISNAAGAGFFNGDENLFVEARINGEWVKVDSDIDDVYPRGTNPATFVAKKYAKLTIKLDKPTACDGIRIKGNVGNYMSIVELKVKAIGLTLTDGRVEKISSPVISSFWDDGFTTNSGSNTGGSTSGGTFTLVSLRDGITDKAYDNYHGTLTKNPTTQWVGYEFPSEFTVEKIKFQNGYCDANKNGVFTSMSVEALIDGKWVAVASDAATAYEAKSWGASTITLERPVTCDGVRVIGSVGGTKNYFTCAEFEVYTTEAHENNLKYTQENAPVNNTYDVRLISVLDRTDYDKAGFEIKTVAGDKTNTVTKDIKNVYTAVLADGKTYTADAGTYFAILTLEDIPTGLGNVSFTVTPYCVENGVTYYGGAVTVTYDTNGALVVA